MAKMGSKGLPQLRRASIHCPIHGNSKISMLSPISCPGCDIERGHSDMLRRSRKKERRWKYQRHDIGRGLEEDGMD